MTKPLIPDLVWQFCVLGTGVDDESTAAWVFCKVEQLPADSEVRQAIRRAIIHWDTCSVQEQGAIGPFFGLGEPHSERWPTLNKIKADYEVLLSFVLALTDEPDD